MFAELAESLEVLVGPYEPRVDRGVLSMSRGAGVAGVREMVTPGAAATHDVAPGVSPNQS